MPKILNLFSLISTPPNSADLVVINELEVVIFCRVFPIGIMIFAVNKLVLLGQFLCLLVLEPLYSFVDGLTEDLATLSRAMSCVIAVHDFSVRCGLRRG